MILRKRALGLSLGVVWGIIVFAATVLATIRGTGITLAKLGNYYPWFTVSYGGALVGLFWAFVSGFLAGLLIAWFYDLFAKALYKSEVQSG